MQYYQVHFNKKSWQLFPLQSIAKAFCLLSVNKVVKHLILGHSEVIFPVSNNSWNVQRILKMVLINTPEDCFKKMTRTEHKFVFSHQQYYLNWNFFYYPKKDSFTKIIMKFSFSLCYVNFDVKNSDTCEGWFIFFFLHLTWEFFSNKNNLGHNSEGVSDAFSVLLDIIYLKMQVTATSISLRLLDGLKWTW